MSKVSNSWELLTAPLVQARMYVDVVQCPLNVIVIAKINLKLNKILCVVLSCLQNLMYCMSQLILSISYAPHPQDFRMTYIVH